MSCKDHPRYKAARKPTNQCEGCWRTYNEKNSSVSFMKDLEESVEEKQIRSLEVSIQALKNDISALKKDKGEAYKEIRELREAMDAISLIEGNHTKPPAWASARKKSSGHRGTACHILSDLHLDERVAPDEVEGLNAYSREIALKRLKRDVERTIMVSRDYVSGVQYDGMALFLLGDLISGWIHEELSETNECPMLETIDYWVDHLSAAVGTFAEEFGNVRVVGIVGNHGRTTRKPRMKQRVTTNMDWLIYRMIARDFKDDDRVSFQVPYSADTTLPLYDTKFLATHGDQFRGGSGVSGVLAPLMTGAYRKTRRAMMTDTNFDYLVMGHFHQYNVFKNIIVNGSLKGYDEYAYMSNFEYEPPQQAFWVVTPEHGITISAPILVENRQKEGW